MKTLLISAGGKNTRIKAFLKDSFDNKPKHILKLPYPSLNGRMTIIDYIIFTAQTFFDEIIVEASKNNIAELQPLHYNYLNTKSVIDDVCSGPLGPPIRKLLKDRSRIFACAGDFFHPDFHWEEFEKFHQSHSKPISILISKSVPMPKGATFQLNSCELITSWARVDHSTADDLINIGCYIIDPDPRIISALEGVTYHKEDVFFDLFINLGFIAGYCPGNMGFNVNTPETYLAMIKALKNLIMSRRLV